MGEQGNLRIFTLPVQEHLSAVAGYPLAWRWANIFMGAAGLVLLAADLWVIFSAFRAVITVGAAHETLATGTVPPYYEPLAQWGFALF